MNEVVIISGKGGTGKTILCASFAALAENAVVADCDVDAANLHLLLHPTVQKTHPFYGNKTARILQENCSQCRECLNHCRFDAVRDEGERIIIDPLSCEGCEVCSRICPAGAAVMEETMAGEWYESKTKYGDFIHARLGIAQENSGKLVTQVRKRSTAVAKNNNRSLVLIDGPPGIGCPVIASLSGTNLALVVTEPTLSGIHDMKRVIKTARHFQTQTACCINKFDLNPRNTEKIETWCQQENVPMLGKIPFDEAVIQITVRGIPLIEGDPSSSVSEKIRDIWEEIRLILNMEVTDHDDQKK
jgi:MinD superfamily P-loop ATPase